MAVAAANRRPQTLLSRESFLNAITVLQAIGGSTNAVVHLMAIINRHPQVSASKEISLQTFDEIGRKVPLLVDLKPSGDNYMHDFHSAGGMLALLTVLRPHLHLSAMTITGETLGESIDKHPFRTFLRSEEIVRPLTNPLYPASSLVVLRGNLAPGGAVMKASASKDRRLLSHSGPAVVFKNSNDLAERIDDPNLNVTEDSVLVLQNIGPIGNPGMPEAGLIPVPRKMAIAGVVDMLRISDGRMSGTAGGSIILHVSPESAIPTSVFGVIKDGDIITCNVQKRLISLEVDQKEIDSRVEAAVVASARKNSVWTRRHSERGYRGLYEREVNQAEHGADFNFLTAQGPQLGSSAKFQ